MIDEITRRGLFERNENIQEYSGTQITTKNLYDVVVRISNVQIKLYKIVEQREYQLYGQRCQRIQVERDFYLLLLFFRAYILLYAKR